MTSPASVFESVLVSVTDVTVFRIDRSEERRVGDDSGSQVAGVSWKKGVAGLIAGPWPSTSAWVIVWLTARSSNAPGARVAITPAGLSVSGLGTAIPVSVT